jgi:periplasmic protein TonB
MTLPESAGGPHSIGWLTSLGLHAGLALGALVVTQRLTLAPQPTPFTWNVAMIAAPSEPPQPSAAPPTAIRTPPTKSSFPKPLPNVSPTTSGDSNPIKTATLEPPLPAPREPIALKTDQPPVGEQISSLPQAVPSTSPLPSQQTELPSESAALTPTPLREDEPVSPAQTSNVAPAVAYTPRPDYAWLSETIMRRMEELKRYPAEARLDRAEGKVVLKAVIRSDGNIESVEIFRGSGHESLDRAAVDLLNLAAPFHFPRPLEKPQMTVKIPMSYRLE